MSKIKNFCYNKLFNPRNIAIAKYVNFVNLLVFVPYVQAQIVGYEPPPYSIYEYFGMDATVTMLSTGCFLILDFILLLNSFFLLYSRGKSPSTKRVLRISNLTLVLFYANSCITFSIANAI